MGFWENADSLVISQGTTYRWLAGKLGKSETTVSGWRRTGVEPRASQAMQIAQALNVSVEYLVTGTDSSDPWIRDNQQLIGNLKSLPSDQLTLIAVQVSAVASTYKSRAALEEEKLVAETRAEEFRKDSG